MKTSGHITFEQHSMTTSLPKFVQTADIVQNITVEPKAPHFPHCFVWLWKLSAPGSV